MIYIIGLGTGQWPTIDMEKREILESAQTIIGASRLLESLQPQMREDQTLIAAIATSEIMAALKKSLAAGQSEIAIVMSGDSLFYSGATPLVPKLREAGLDFKLLPGISAVQMLAARLETPWQDWRLVSAHGRTLDPVAEIGYGQPVFFLTGGQWTPDLLCAELNKAGYGSFYAAVGENLGLEDERLTEGTVQELAAKSYDSLSVLLVAASQGQSLVRKNLQRQASGLPDGAFVRGDVPMTKQEVRALVMAKLAVKEGEIAWDVGAGTGSVAIEMALQGATVFAIERKPEACALIAQNAKRLSAHRLEIREGQAAQMILDCPRPDIVFIGGSSGEMRTVIERALSLNPGVRLCVTAIALETLSEVVRILADLELKYELTQMAVSRARELGSYHLLMAENPIFIITLNCRY